MSTVITTANANWRATSDRIIQPIADLPTFLLPRTNSKRGVMNYIKGGEDAIAVSSPVFNPSWADLDGVLNNHIDSRLLETSAMTIICVVRTFDTLADAAHRPYFVSTASGAAADGSGRFPAGVCICISSNNKFQFISGRWNGTVGNTQALDLTLDPTVWHFLVARCADNYRDFWDMTTGERLSTASTWARDPTNNTLRLGRRFLGNANSEGKSQMAHFAGLPRVLSDDEAVEYYDFMRPALARLPVPVIC